MKEDEAKVKALEFALEMCRETRRSVIEECAKVADRHAEEAIGFTEEEAAAHIIAQNIRALNGEKP